MECNMSPSKKIMPRQKNQKTKPRATKSKGKTAKLHKIKKPNVIIPDILRQIRKRKSTRNFREFPMDAAAMTRVKTALKAAKRLSAAFSLSWEIDKTSPVGSGRIYAAEPKKAAGKPEVLVEYGFQGEAIVLALTGAEYATCWNAVGKALVAGSPAVIVFGKADDKGFIAKTISLVIGSKRRKSLEDVLDPDGLLPAMDQIRVLDAMRIAPSAMNRQPWLFRVTSKNEISVKKLKGHPRWTFIDLGIALCHGYAAAKALFSKAKVKRIDAETYSISW
ncbi:MAG: hypothetical protein EHM28_05750 [Spirochaetaceae bacterium]|nr:MAG: hypothetical protein EHM28_05750 [Spirochaetaceae bacterium]